MSKQAEQKAIERYPITAENGERAFLARGFFVKGYEQAEKETIERAISWIKNNTCMGVYEQELMRKELEDEK